MAHQYAVTVTANRHTNQVAEEVAGKETRVAITISRLYEPTAKTEAVFAEGAERLSSNE